MRCTVSKAFQNIVLLPASVLILLSSVSGSGSKPGVGLGLPGPHERQNQTTTKSQPGAPANPQVKAVLDKMAAAGIARPATVADVRKAYAFYPDGPGRKCLAFSLYWGREPPQG